MARKSRTPAYEQLLALADTPPTTQEQILALAEDYEENARALRLTATLLARHSRNGGPTPAPAPQERDASVTITRPAFNPTLRAKVKAHFKKQIAHRAPKKDAAPKVNVAANRARSAAILDRLDRVEPRRLDDASRFIGPLVRRGYAKRKGDGYIRTAKPYDLKLKKAKHAAATVEPDAETAALTVAQAARQLAMSESGIRLLVKQGKLRGHMEKRLRPGWRKPVDMIMVDRDDVARYGAVEGS